MSSCSNVPDGPNPRMPARRIASLTAAGAALSAKTQPQTSVFSGPRGCQTRKVRETERSIEKFGKSVPTIGLPGLGAAQGASPPPGSEGPTSELQSHGNFLFRPLPEKKKSS